MKIKGLKKVVSEYNKINGSKENVDQVCVIFLDMVTGELSTRVTHIRDNMQHFSEFANKISIEYWALTHQKETIVNMKNVKEWAEEACDEYRKKNG